MHIGGSNVCRLSPAAIMACGSFADKNGMAYDCYTNYTAGKIGCAPNAKWGPSPKELARSGTGVMAMEWTEDFIRIFHLKKEPNDLARNAPDPDSWPASAIVSYYPFKASEETCPDYKKMISPQNVILNMAMCGDWAGHYGWTHDLGCELQGALRTRRPLATCNEYVLSEGASKDLVENANMNISYVKVFTPAYR